MEFSEKYELLESLTSGSVETFIANDKRKNERVLVHILHCEPQRPNQPTVQWVLDGFRKVAPEPVGLVLETGKYSGTLYAFVVTRLPEDAALKTWIQQYNARKTGTHEIPAPAATPEAKVQPPIDQHATVEIPIPQKETARVPVQFTQMFREFGSQPVPSPPMETAKEPELPLRGVPSLDDPEHPSGMQAAPQWEARTSEKTSLGSLNPPEAIPSSKNPDPSFSAQFSVKDFPTETIPTAPKTSVKAGEFTSFFQGPFRPDVPADIPPMAGPPSGPHQKPGGSFTDLFSAVTGQPEPPLVSSGPEKKSGSTGFTGWFSDPDILSRTPETPASSTTPAPDAAVFPAPSKEPTAPKPVAPQPPPAATPAAPVFPLPKPVVAKSPAIPSVSPSPEGATRAFSAPTVEPVHVEPAHVSGPSPYTQVISMRPQAPADAADAEAPEKAAGGGASAFKLPQIQPPKITAPRLEGPKIQGPKIQASPVPVPKIQAPPMALPKIKAPKPQAPKLEEQKPPVSYWPLVITLTILFCLAILLVLYFVLKH